MLPPGHVEAPERHKKNNENVMFIADTIFHLISLSKFNLPLIGTFYVTHASRALQSNDLSGEGIKLWITYILF